MILIPDILNEFKKKIKGAIALIFCNSPILKFSNSYCMIEMFEEW